MRKGSRRVDNGGKGTPTKSPNPKDKKAHRTTYAGEDPEQIDPELVKNLFPAVEQDSSLPVLLALKPEDPIPTNIPLKQFRNNHNDDNWSKYGVQTAAPFVADLVYGEGDDFFHDAVKPFVQASNVGKIPWASKTSIQMLYSTLNKTLMVDATQNREKILLVTSRLAKSDPEHLFHAGDFTPDKTARLPTDLARAWIVSVAIFGPRWTDFKETDTTGGKAESTSTQEPIAQPRGKENVTPDTSTGKESAIASETPRPNIWKEAFQDNRSETTVEQERAEVPETTPRPNAWTEVPHGKRKTTFVTTSGNDGQAGRHNLTNPYRLNKPLAQNRNDSHADGKEFKTTKFKFLTFVKVKLATTMEETFEAQAMEAGRNLRCVMLELWKMDTKVEILPWDKNSAAPSLTNKSKPISSRDGFKTYAHRGLWTQREKNAYIRVRMAHNVKREDLFGDPINEVLSAHQMNISVELIQAEEISEIGAFLGSHPSLFNHQNWIDAHKLVPSLAQIALEFRVKNMLSSKGRQKKESETLVRAVHVFSAAKDAKKVRNALLELYSSKNKALNPIGSFLRFIPNINDNRMVITEDMRMMSVIARAKQRCFLKNTSTVENENIHGLYYVIDEYGLNLKEAVMSLKSSRCPDKKLFVGIEENWSGSKILLVYHNDMEREAMAINSALPLFLAEHLGPRVWTWFSPELKIALGQCKWDAERGLVDATDRVAELHDFDEDLDDDISMASGIQIHLENLPEISFQVHAENETNPYGDAGTIRSEFFRGHKSSASQPPPDIMFTFPNQPTPTTVSTDNTQSEPSSMGSAMSKEDILNKFLEDPDFKSLLLAKLNMTGQNESTAGQMDDT